MRKGNGKTPHAAMPPGVLAFMVQTCHPLPHFPENLPGPKNKTPPYRATTVKKTRYTASESAEFTKTHASAYIYIYTYTYLYIQICAETRACGRLCAYLRIGTAFAKNRQDALSPEMGLFGMSWRLRSGSCVFATRRILVTAERERVCVATSFFFRRLCPIARRRVI